MTKPSERDDLAGEIVGTPIDSGYYSSSVNWEAAREIADILIAAGYHK